MKNIKLTSEQLENMSYTDVAHLVLKEQNEKMTIQDIFKQVIEIKDLPESYFENKIGDFFGLLSTDKRFVLLDKGYWDLRDNHVNNVIIDEDDDEELIVLDEDNTTSLEEDSNEVNYDDDKVDDDEDEDDLKDLVIVDEDELEEG